MDKSDWVLGWIVIVGTIIAVAIPPHTFTEFCLGGGLIIQTLNTWASKAFPSQRETKP